MIINLENRSRKRISSESVPITKGAESSGKNSTLKIFKMEKGKNVFKVNEKEISVKKLHISFKINIHLLSILD